MMAPPFTFLHQKGEPAGERIVRCCKSVLANGPIGDKQEPELYRYFVGCGDPARALAGGGDIGKVRTSCAVFAGAVLWWCGSPDRARLRPARVGWPMFGGWLGSLSRRHPAWAHAQLGYCGDELICYRLPLPGTLFYLEHPKNPNNNHVGFFLENEPQSDEWLTAEGGGGDGTECALRRRMLGRSFDRHGRVLLGWWLPALLGLIDTREAE